MPSPPSPPAPFPSSSLLNTFDECDWLGSTDDSKAAGTDQRRFGTHLYFIAPYLLNSSRKRYEFRTHRDVKILKRLRLTCRHAARALYHETLSPYLTLQIPNEAALSRVLRSRFQSFGVSLKQSEFQGVGHRDGSTLAGRQTGRAPEGGRPEDVGVGISPEQFGKIRFITHVDYRKVPAFLPHVPSLRYLHLRFDGLCKEFVHLDLSWASTLVSMKLSGGIYEVPPDIISLDPPPNLEKLALFFTPLEFALPFHSCQKLAHVVVTGQRTSNLLPMDTFSFDSLVGLKTLEFVALNNFRQSLLCTTVEEVILHNPTKENHVIWGQLFESKALKKATLRGGHDESSVHHLTPLNTLAPRPRPPPASIHRGPRFLEHLVVRDEALSEHCLEHRCMAWVFHFLLKSPKLKHLDAETHPLTEVDLREQTDLETVRVVTHDGRRMRILLDEKKLNEFLYTRLSVVELEGLALYETTRLALETLDVSLSMSDVLTLHHIPPRVAGPPVEPPAAPVLDHLRRQLAVERRRGNLSRRRRKRRRRGNFNSKSHMLAETPTPRFHFQEDFN